MSIISGSLLDIGKINIDDLHEQRNKLVSQWANDAENAGISYYQTTPLLSAIHFERQGDSIRVCLLSPANLTTTGRMVPVVCTMSVEEFCDVRLSLGIE